MFAVAVFAAGFIIFLPAKSALGMVKVPAALSYGSVHGSIWSIRFEDAALFQRPVGVLRFSPGLTSIAGNLAGRVRISGAGTTADFRLTVAEVLRIENLSLSMVVRSNIDGTPLEGALSIEDASLSLDKSGRCFEAAGQFETDAFKSVMTAFGLGGDSMVADLVCDDGALGFTFSRTLDGGGLEAAGRVVGPALLQLDMQLRFDDRNQIPQQWIERLSQRGFEPTENGWRSSVRVPL